MEFLYTPNFIGTSFVKNEVSDDSGSFEATSADLPIIKEALRKSMPAAKPTLRLEYAARGFGYRTAAALQSAVILPGLKSGASFSFTGDCGRHGPAVLCRLQRRSRVAAADAVPRRP